MRRFTRGSRSSSADRGRLIGLAALAVGLMLLTAAPAQARDCAEKTAKRVTIDEVARDLDRFEGQCITVSGILERDRLYADQDAIYQARSGFEFQYQDYPPDPRRIGLRPYHGWTKHPAGSRRSVTVTGVVHDCAQYWRKSPDDGENTIVMATGYCHYNGGAVMVPASVRGGSKVKLHRATGPEVAQRIGDVLPAPADWPHREAVMVIINRYLTALRSGDRDGFVGLSRLTHLQDDDIDSHRELRLLLAGSFDRPVPAMAALRAGMLGDPVLFIPRWPVGTQPSAQACFFPRDYPASNWPISSFDMGIANGRPYVCVALTSYHLTDAGTSSLKWTVETNFDPHPFSEPRAPRKSPLKPRLSNDTA